MEPSLSLPAYAYDPEPGVALYLEQRHGWVGQEWGDDAGEPGNGRNSLSVRGVEPAQLRRHSPIPPTQPFPTVPELEEPNTPGGATEEEQVVIQTEVREAQSHHLPTREGSGRKHRRRLPFISTAALIKSRSSRSFDSGISNLLSDSGSPSPPLPGEDPRAEIEEPVAPRNVASSLFANASPSASPGPPRSPVTPSKRASFHAITRTVPAQLPRTPNPPNSPSYKVQSGSKPGFFSARRLSEQNGHHAAENGGALGRTLSPISVPQSPGLTKSPSPVYSSSSKSSPQLQGSPILRPSNSLHSNESSSSPPKSPDTYSPLSPAASPPVSRISRRLLPETPSTPTHVAKELPKARPGAGVRKIAWQLVTSHDSLDSGVYSRSNTTDSVRDSVATFARATSSPALPPAVTASPTLARHHSWRKSTGARLPELPSLPQEQTRRQSLPGAQQCEVRLHSDSVEGLNLTPKRTCDGAAREQVTRDLEERWVDQARRREDCDGVANSLAAGLEVPRLRELKSHSFPPPWDADEQEAELLPDSADQRRRRWIYCRTYLSDQRYVPDLILAVAQQYSNSLIRTLFSIVIIC